MHPDWVRRAGKPPPRAATGRCTHCRRFTYGRAKSCRRRQCCGYAPLWAGDQRRKLFENLGAYAGECVVLAVTAPGADQLPWDAKHCQARGETMCTAGLLELQRRGVLHVHPVLGFRTPAERHAAHLYSQYLFGLAPSYGFGFHGAQAPDPLAEACSGLPVVVLRDGEERQALAAGVSEGSTHAEVDHPCIDRTHSGHRRDDARASLSPLRMVLGGPSALPAE